MRRLRFEAAASQSVDGSPAEAWAWADRLPEALTEFAFVRAVHPGELPDTYTLELSPVGFGKVSLSLQLAMHVERHPGKLLRMQSLPGSGNADAIVSVEVRPSDDPKQCELSIALDVSPHKPAAAFWPRELIEKASSASLRLAARKMLDDMKRAIENGSA